MKLLLNSAYGCSKIEKNKHRNIVNVKGEQQLRPLDDDIFEVEMTKRKIKYDVTNYLAHFILNTAKLGFFSTAMAASFTLSQVQNLTLDLWTQTLYIIPFPVTISLM